MLRSLLSGRRRGGWFKPPINSQIERTIPSALLKERGHFLDARPPLLIQGSLLQRHSRTTTRDPVRPLQRAKYSSALEYNSIVTAFAVRTKSYFANSRAPRYSVLFALPLLVIYEGLAALLGSNDGGSLRNGADVLFRSVFTLVAGRNGS